MKIELFTADYYTAETLIGRQVAAVVNFPPRQIGLFMLEVLTFGFPNGKPRAIVIFQTEALTIRDHISS